MYASIIRKNDDFFFSSFSFLPRIFRRIKKRKHTRTQIVVGIRISMTKRVRHGVDSKAGRGRGEVSNFPTLLRVA